MKRGREGSGSGSADRNRRDSGRSKLIGRCSLAVSAELAGTIPRPCPAYSGAGDTERDAANQQRTGVVYAELAAHSAAGGWLSAPMLIRA